MDPKIIRHPVYTPYLVMVTTVRLPYESLKALPLLEQSAQLTTLDYLLRAKVHWLSIANLVYQLQTINKASVVA